MTTRVSFQELERCVDKIREQILQKSTIEIKRTGHNNRKKPWCREISILLPGDNDLKAFLAEMLFDEHDDSTFKWETGRMIKWGVVGSQAVMNFLGTDEEFVHPVIFDGKCRANPLTGAPAPIPYAYAAYMEMKAKYNKYSGESTLQFRTHLAGTRRAEPLPGGAANAYELTQMIMNGQLPFDVLYHG